ncbi:hypothetical protein [Pseudolysinimonas sp.]|jgi:hypothetical protein|uniref:hypothetical protein n=1 Tax=Pseudolysinimonas sp. TaxID=2680009 RepID=UPI0037840160
MHRTLASVPLLALVALLVGCGPTPPGDTPVDPRPTPTGSPVALPTPTTTPTIPAAEIDPLDTVTRILVLTEQVRFCDDVACTIDGFRYDGDPALAVAKLTAVFGTAPASERYDDGGGQFSEYHDWGGLLLYFSTIDSGPLGMGVSVDAGAVEGVAVETEHGVRVGTPMSEALENADLVYTQNGESGDVYEAHFDVIAADANNLRAVIAFRAIDTAGPVTSISAPISTGDSSGPAAGF